MPGHSVVWLLRGIQLSFFFILECTDLLQNSLTTTRKTSRTSDSGHEHFPVFSDKVMSPVIRSMGLFRYTFQYFFKELICASWEFLAATKQLYEWFSSSVCLSDIFLTMFSSSYHHEIFRRDYQWQKWGLSKRFRSEDKVTEVKTQCSSFQTVTRVWINRWLWNDAQSLMWFRRCPIVFQGHLSNFKVTRIKKSVILTQLR